jgi:hypothetical protein
MEGSGAASWRKSSYSGNNGGDCVEVGMTPGAVLMRDTKDQHGPVLSLSAGTWQAFAGPRKTRTDGLHMSAPNRLDRAAGRLPIPE